MTTEIPTELFDLSHLTSLCHRKKNIMSRLLEDAAPFLFPCTIEYSLICAAIEFVMVRFPDAVYYGKTKKVPLYVIFCLN